MFRETNNRRGEGWTLSNLGKTYYAHGQLGEARTYLDRALRMRREVDRRGAGRTLNNLGEVYASMGQRERARALAALLLAQRLLDELQSPYRYSAQEGLDALRQELGEKQFAELRTKVGPRAPQIVKEALG